MIIVTSSNHKRITVLTLEKLQFPKALYLYPKTYWQSVDEGGEVALGGEQSEGNQKSGGPMPLSPFSAAIT